jgi:hypothetical protein
MSRGVIIPYSDWPRSLQILILAPNALLAGFACWAWWPKSNREWRRFGFVLAYLAVFFSVMVFTFHFADSGGKP